MATRMNDEDSMDTIDDQHQAVLSSVVPSQVAVDISRDTASIQKCSRYILPYFINEL